MSALDSVSRFDRDIGHSKLQGVILLLKWKPCHSPTLGFSLSNVIWDNGQIGCCSCKQLSVFSTSLECLSDRQQFIFKLTRKAFQFIPSCCDAVILYYSPTWIKPICDTLRSIESIQYTQICSPGARCKYLYHTSLPCLRLHLVIRCNVSQCHGKPAAWDLLAFSTIKQTEREWKGGREGGRERFSIRRKNQARMFSLACEVIWYYLVKAPSGQMKGCGSISSLAQGCSPWHIYRFPHKPGPPNDNDRTCVFHH